MLAMFVAGQVKDTDQACIKMNEEESSVNPGFKETMGQGLDLIDPILSVEVKDEFKSPEPESPRGKFNPFIKQLLKSSLQPRASIIKLKNYGTNGTDDDVDSAPKTIN